MFILPQKGEIITEKKDNIEPSLEELEKEIPQKADLAIFQAIFDDEDEEED